MKLKTILLIAIALFAILGIAYYLGFNHGYEKAVWALNNQSTTTSTPTNTNTTSENVYHNSDYGFSIKYPPEMPPKLSFDASYLLPDAWSVYATATSTGEKIVAFVVPKSNNVTAGAVRIGVSNDPDQIATCTQSPEFAHFPITTTTINGVIFTVINGSDAAMSHYSTVKSYRTVHNNNCYVIDTFVYGSNPEVYSPPTTSPFSIEQGFATIDPIVYTFKFD